MPVQCGSFPSPGYSPASSSIKSPSVNAVRIREQRPKHIASSLPVCYGMLEGLPITAIQTTTLIDSSQLVYAFLVDDGMVQRTSDGVLIGKLDETATQALFKLAEEEVHIQFMVKANNSGSPRQQKSRTIAFASVILYGPEDLGEDIGDFLDKCNYCLQDPFSCELDVPYKNPHCLSTLFEQPSMTSGLSRPQPSPAFTFSISETFNTLETTETLQEWHQPIALRTKLHKHQKQALWYMIMRESSQNARTIWQPKVMLNGHLMFQNGIDGSQQDTPPPIWNGGILADEMGLGKTLQMIALITEAKTLQAQSQTKDVTPRLYLGHSVPTTIIILPLPLISVWEEQLTRHVSTGKLTWQRHHGKSRFQIAPGFGCPDIVITTYHTVQSEYKRRHKDHGTLFNYQWRRIILDEAHIIRNKNTVSSAVCSLDAISRWAVTGTPIQNSLSDLCGIFKFLGFQPYNDPKVIDEHIFEFIRQEDPTEGIRRLKMLCNTVMIRRRKAVLDLLPRTDLTKTIEFSQEEAWFYKELENRLHYLPDDTNTYMSAIQLINKLRVFCNLGLSSPSGMISRFQQRDAHSTEPERDVPIDTILASDLTLGGVNCTGCEELVGITKNVDNAYAYYSTCGKMYCTACASLMQNRSTADCSCVDKSLCTLRILSSDVVESALGGINEISRGSEITAISSKVSAVIEDVRMNLSEKSVVFSFWTTSLDMVQYGLSCYQIPCVRIDGTIDQARRDRVLQQFRRDDSIKILLITISCGGVGLDLTAASRVHLLEPQWNPAMEDQALARVYRMGQQRPVVTIRYMMKDSIEESVASVKDKKQLLAELLPLTAHPTTMSDA